MQKEKYIIKVGLFKYGNSTKGNNKRPYTTNNDTHINMAQPQDSNEDNVKKEPLYNLLMDPTHMLKDCILKELIELKRGREYAKD